MSADPRSPKKRSFLGRIFCCVAPGEEEDDEGTQTHVRREPATPTTPGLSRQEEAKTHSPLETADQVKTTPAVPTIEDEKTASDPDRELTQQERNTDVAAPTPSKTIAPVTQGTSFLSGLQPALNRDTSATTGVDPNSPTVGNGSVAMDEDKAALIEDEPLTPSSAAITATVPVENHDGQVSSLATDQQGGQWLLPPLASTLSGKKCLVLDLDETLVHSSFKVIHQADFVVPVEIDGIYHNVYVIKRPGVDDFMLEVGRHFEIVVFTASLAKYADPVLDILDVHKVVHHRLFRESCHNHMGNYVKDLSQLGRDLKDAIIIDNSPASYVFHPAHAVPISSWFNDVHDTELTDLIPFLVDLTTVDDVSQVLELSLS